MSKEKTFTPDEIAKIEKHRQLAENMEFRQSLFKHFAPRFCYSEGEQNFPSDPDDFLRNVIEAKREHYTKNESKLNELEKKELAVINKYFWKDGQFNEEYYKHKHETDYREVAFEKKNAAHFLTFNEKKYGYKLGGKIDVVGPLPPDHPKHDKSKKSAPIAASVIPTPTGFFLQYDYTYPLNHAIPGTQWLYKLLPDSISKRFDDFGFHYGDCEGVGVHVNVDEHGKATFGSLQTFAHGSKGARNVLPKDCTFKDGRVCVFVGEGPHPSYADNFIGRSKFADRVGDKYHLIPETFIDVSKDIMDIASPKPNFTEINENTEEKSKVAKMVPKAWYAVHRMAGGLPLSTTGVNTPEKLLSDTQVNKWSGYKPMLALDKAWNKVWKKTKEFLNIITRPKGYELLKENNNMPESIDIPGYKSELGIVREGQSGQTLHEQKLNAHVAKVLEKRKKGNSTNKIGL